MNLLKKLSGLFTASPSGRNTYLLSVQCHRCGEVLQAQVNLANELSADYDENGKVIQYHCRKVVLGTQRCFQPIELVLTFNAQRQLTDQQVTGGKVVAE